jgi:integrase
MAAEKIRLTDARVRELVLPEGKVQVDVWDADQPGFGIRLGTKSKTFFVMGRVNGRAVRPKIGRFPKIGTAAARSRARIMLAEMEQGINPTDLKRADRADQAKAKADRLDVSDTVAAMFESMLRIKPYSPVTAQGYRYNFKLLHPFHQVKVDQITRQQVVGLHLSVTQNNGPYAANRASQVLSAILNHARALLGRPANNPVKALSDVGAWCKEQPREQLLEPDQFPAFAACVSGLGGYNATDIYRLLMYTGMRKSEAFSLQWQNIDLQADALTVPKTKNGKPLTLPLPRQVKTILSARWEQWNRPESGPVFPTHSKRGYVKDDSLFAAKIKKVVPGFSAHWLRKAFTTAAVTIGLDGMVIDRLTNHAAIGMTARHYYKPTVDSLREPMQRIADHIDAMINSNPCTPANPAV